MGYIRRDMTPLAEYVYQRMEQLGLSIRDLAKKMDISHSTLLDHLSDSPPDHKIDLLANLAHSLNADLCTIVAIVKPEETKLNPKVMQLADRMAHLPPDLIERFENELIGLAFKENKKSK